MGLNQKIYKISAFKNKTKTLMDGCYCYAGENMVLAGIE